MSVTPALEIDGIHVAYGRTPVLRGLSLTLPAGSATALVGPNGAGKTTLLRAVSGTVAVTQGALRLHGSDITQLTPYQRARKGLCHVPESGGVYPGLTVRDNLMMSAPPSSRRDVVDRVTEVFPVLGRRLGQAAGTMSGGEQRMLSLAAAYLRDPTLVVVDEPSLGLAPLLVDEVFRFLGRIAAQGTALLVVDQYVHRVLELATEVHVMRGGSIVHSGPATTTGADELFGHYVGSG
jgi:branched-chain amino acid transport system ATP-binding protein